MHTPNPLSVCVAAITNTGNHRSANEDCIAICEWVRAASMKSPMMIEMVLDEPRIVLIADGMGGQNHGQTASSMTVQYFARTIAVLVQEEDLASALHEANRRLYKAMSSSPVLRGMGTTIAGVLLLPNKAILFNVGDSRIYLQSGKCLRLLSQDDTHSFGHQNIAQTTGTMGHVLTQSLGGCEQYTPIQPHILARDAEPGERYLLCSDGLTDMLNLDAIESCLSPSGSETVRKLMETALEAGGKDNISVAMIELILQSGL